VVQYIHTKEKEKQEKRKEGADGSGLDQNAQQTSPRT
jgi:hypothetical protein